MLIKQNCYAYYCYSINQIYINCKQGLPCLEPIAYFVNFFPFILNFTVSCFNDLRL